MGFFLVCLNKPSSSCSSPYTQPHTCHHIRNARMGGGRGDSPGRHGWRSPSPAADTPPWPPRCSSSRCRRCPTSECRYAPPGPPPGPRKGCGRRSDAAAGHKNSSVNKRHSKLHREDATVGQATLGVFWLKTLSPETSVELLAEQLMHSGSSSPTMDRKPSI